MFAPGATDALSGRQAPRGTSHMERVTGIEPAWPAWKAGALPLSYTRVLDNASGTESRRRPLANSVDPWTRRRCTTE